MNTSPSGSAVNEDTRRGVTIVIMGVSGAGKSTVGDLLAKLMDYEFVDADDFHPLSNKEKMKSGMGLTEEDRTPWLETLRDEVLRKRIKQGKSVILSCSALRKRYREILRSADCDFGGDNCEKKSLGAVKFVFLDADAEVLARRLEARAAQGNHFMPPSLLQSQLDLLEIDDDDDDDEEGSIFKELWASSYRDSREDDENYQCNRCKKCAGQRTRNPLAQGAVLVADPDPVRALVPVMC